MRDHIMVNKSASRIGIGLLATIVALTATTFCARADSLLLQLDRFTGGATLLNPAENTTSFSFIGYTLNAPSNPLTSSDGRWNSLHDSGVPTWFEANPTVSNL